MGLSHLPADELASWVRSSCESQGLPVKVSDPTVMRRVGALLGAAGAGPRAQPRSGSTRTGPQRSMAPHDADPGRVQLPGTGLAGTDHSVVDDRGHDGVLPPEVEGVPRAS